ncbi:deoxyribodipyrimidine photo-lyase [Sinosporangium album]|uniref:Deoxyribodipyrimidine photo-lyase n=1 Tax=Sinosporangium album TaxID=504805 RepID=A0A1G7UZW5_9ACTN|nr:deoxyribodipyrimidine photo-lyase [Sinosporangium album]
MIGARKCNRLAPGCESVGVECVIVLFNRDLRVHDHPALDAACDRARSVVPLFVIEPKLPSGHRGGFLLDCLADLRSSLRDRGGDLVVRRGDAVAETMRLADEVGADAVWTSADVSGYARGREGRLAAECERARLDFQLFGGVTVVAPGAVVPAGGGDHYRVFTPYWRAWQATRRRAVLPAPERVALPAGLAPGRIPASFPGRRGRSAGGVASGRSVRHGTLAGGETAARERLQRWLRFSAADYPDVRDDLAGDGTSKVSPYLRFGCLSPLEVVTRAEGVGGEEFTRQLCWRDFFHQVAYAFPEINRRDYRPGGGEWRDDKDALDAWREGHTGIPIVDAGMRQLEAEGWMHNRARMIVASYLVKHLRVDWRLGADHFFDLLLDGDVANNSGNWQWAAGTGNDTRPNRVLNPIRQAKRFDPDGDYVRRYVPELEHLSAKIVHEPWKLPSPLRRYPPPLTPPPTA